MNITFKIEDKDDGRVEVFSMLTYEKVKKVKSVHPKYKWWVERKYEHVEITRKVKFGEFTLKGIGQVVNAGLLKDTELDNKGLKELRRTARKIAE